MKAAIKRKETASNREDVITSNIFGSMTYLDNQLVAEKFTELLMKFNANIMFKEPSEIILEFWPNIADKGRVEPDIRIKIKDDCQNEIVLIVEIKWYSVQSHNKEDLPQLLQQWACIDKGQHKNTYHIYLVLDKGNADKEIKQMAEKHETLNFDKWQERLIVLSWRELIDIFNDQKIKQKSKGYKQWIEDVLVYYQLLEHNFPPFTGFNFLNTYKTFVDKGDPVFWNDFFQFDQFDFEVVLKKETFIFLKE